MKVKIYLDDSFPSMRRMIEFKRLSPEAKNILAQNYRHVHLRNVVYSEDDTKITVSLNILGIHTYLGAQAHIKNKNLGYITYYKDSKKLKSFNKKEVVSVLLREKKLHKILGIEALVPVKNEETDAYYGRRGQRASFELMVYSDNRVLKGIFQGKLTNREKIFKKKFSSLGHKGFGFMKYMRVVQVFGASTAYRMMKVAKNWQNLYNFAVEEEQARVGRSIGGRQGLSNQRSIMDDLIEMKLTLREKVDFKWSPARMEEEHDKCSIRIHTIKCLSLPLEEVIYDYPMPELPGLTLLKSNRELVFEGDSMHHCVGSSDHYTRRMLNRENMYLHYEHDGIAATAEVHIHVVERKVVNSSTPSPYTVQFKVGQFSLRRNGTPPTFHRQRLQNFLDTLEHTDFVFNFIEKKFDEGRPKKAVCKVRRVKEEVVLEETSSYGHAELMPFF